MTPWLSFLITLSAGASIGALAMGLVAAARRQEPLPRFGLWRGRESGTEFYLDGDWTAWFREGPKPHPESHRRVERAERIE